MKKTTERVKRLKKSRGQINECETGKNVYAYLLLLLILLKMCGSKFPSKRRITWSLLEHKTLNRITKRCQNR